MNQAVDRSWASSLPDPHADPTSSAFPDDEFADFLNFDNMATDLNYSIFDDPTSLTPAVLDQFSSRSSRTRSQNPTEAGHEDQQHPAPMSVTNASSFTPQSQAQYLQNHPGTLAAAFNGQDSFHNNSKAAFPHNGYQQPFSVPPTPDSIGMYPTPQEYMPQAKSNPNQLQQPYPLNASRPNSYTPGISPDFQATPANYNSNLTSAPPGTLSPLTSPAMTPQNKHPAFYTQNQPAASNSNQGTPQADIGMENLSSDSVTGQERPRKSRRKAAAVKPALAPSARTRKATTAALKRQSSLNSQNSVAKSAGSQPRSASSRSNRRMSIPSAGLSNPGDLQHAATPDSASPQPQAGPAMAPPPKPLTPAATPQTHPTSQPHRSMIAGSPATPASMMRIQPAKNSAAPSGNDGSSSTTDGPMMSPETYALESGMEVLRLPEAAAPPPPSAINGGANGRIKPSSTNNQSSNPTSQSASESPRSSALTSPNGPTAMSKTSDAPTPTAKGGKNTMKRNSNQSVHVSPALRPRISPAIKPILPEGTNVTEQTQALLLASRSNYQNIIENSHLPGVSYPTDLSTNLTSKRTSHKIAEQGRRNRINTALQEMQGLLPSRFSAAAARDVPVEEIEVDANGTATVDGQAGKNGCDSRGTPKTPATPMQSGNSKAATVESAIMYIRHLQDEATQRERDIERLEGEVGSLKAGGRAIKSVNAIRIATLCKHHKDPFAYLVFLPTVRKAAVAHPILLTIADSSDPRRADPTRSSFQHARHQTQSHRAAHPHARASSTQDVHDPLPHRTRQQSECPTRSRTRISGPASAAAALK